MVKRKHIRLKDFDYSSSGAYFVTICTNFKKPIIGDNERALIEAELSALEERFSGVKVDFYVIMNNHIHLIFLFNYTAYTLPQIVQAFKSLTTLRLQRNGFKGEVVWQRNYFEHVIRNETTLDKIREYIRNNPMVQELKLEDILKSSKLDHYKLNQAL